MIKKPQPPIPKDKPLVIKRPGNPGAPKPAPKLKPPPQKIPPPMILDAPRRVKPKKREILDILDAFGDEDAPVGKRSSIERPPSQIARRIQNQLRIMPA